MVVVEYKYNAWGIQLSRTGELANTLGYANPFRYRGYIYDDETWMYWLRSRYYYPELHRFINADELLGVVGGLTTHNAYAYCANAPVDRADHSGYFAAKMLSEDEDGIPWPTNNLSGGASSMAVVGGYASNGQPDAGLKEFHPGRSKPNVIDKNSELFKQRTALNELVKPFAQQRGISLENAEILISWGHEYGFAYNRIDPGHPGRSGYISQIYHAHIGDMNHIPIVPIIYVNRKE